MTTNELSIFRAALGNKRAELGGRQSRALIAVEDSPDEMDRIQDAADRDYAIGSMERDSGRLRDVECALGRLNADTFGICTGCDGDISPKRLAAVPWASLCIVCQEAADTERKTPWTEMATSLVMAA